MKNWRTTLCGIIIAACAGIAGAAGMDATITKIAGVIGVIATAAMGFLAKDAGVTGPEK